MKIKNFTQILIVLLLTIKFKPLMCHEISDLRNDNEEMNVIHKEGQIRGETSTFNSTVTIPRATENPTVNSTSSKEKITTETNFNNSQIEETKEESVSNKSIEYLIEEPNNLNSSHKQEVIIKPLNEISVKLKDNFTDVNSENEQKFILNLTDSENKSYESIREQIADQIETEAKENTAKDLNMEPKILNNTLIESQNEDRITLPVYEKKEELIINLLNPSNNEVTTSILRETIMSSNKSDTRHTRAENQITTALPNKSDQILESTMTSIKMRINPLNKILKLLTKESATTTENHSIETLKAESIPATRENLNLNNQYTMKSAEKVETINSTFDPELMTTSANFKNFSIESPPKEMSNLKHEDISNQLAVSNADDLEKPKYIESTTVSTLLQTLISSSGTYESEEEESETKPLTTLEDYAVKQMNFILDHMLLECQEFVANVLQATSNTIFQRDHLKRYAENINRLLNSKHEIDYSDDISDYYRGNNPKDLYEEVVKKLNFFKSKASKQLQVHLPGDWLKDYNNRREELKIWLDKASYEMHREFNLYLDEEEDHIKCLYFNEAFDDIIRATEIHQKLALLADLIKIVKNKKQITFMDLYMQ